VASERAAALAARLEAAAAALIAALSQVEPDRWSRVPSAGVWSIGKDAEHVIEAGVYHEWIVLLTIGDKVASKRPAIERAQLTTELSPAQAVATIRTRAVEVADLLRGLTDEQLDRSTRPPRARAAILADTIDRVLIGHVDAHRADIEAKMRAPGV